MKKYSNNIKPVIAGLIILWSGASLSFAQDDQPLSENVNDSVPESRETYVINNERLINTGFSTFKKRDFAGSAHTIRPDDFTDINSTQWVRSAIEGRLLGVKGSGNVRGLGNALFVVDGIPGRNINHLFLEEIEDITVLKDASAVALYGSQGRNGVIIINTKSGNLSDNSTRISIDHSFKMPIALPQYVGSVEYMELFNEARINDGLSPLYLEEDIENYRPDLNPYKYPDVDLYSDEYLKPMIHSTNVLAQFSGGIKKAQYYVNMGWDFNGSLEKLNPEANAGVNRFNVRGNIDFRVNDFISSSVGIFSVINTNRVAQASVINEGTTYKPNSYSPLLPVNLIDTTGNPQLAGQLNAANTFDGSLLASTQSINTNAPIADILGGGYRNYMFRTTQFNNRIDFDLDNILNGLTAQTYLSFDFYDAYTTLINNEYAVYVPTWNEDNITGLEKYGKDRKSLNENISTRDFISRLGFYGKINYTKSFSEDHFVNSSLIGFSNTTMFLNNTQNDNNSHLGLQLYYKYKNKLITEFSSAYVHSIKLPEGNRNAFSPTIALAYILSEDDFIKNNTVIDYLKIRASTGIINSDLSINDYFIYQQIYQNPGGWFNWADQYNNRVTGLAQGANPNLFFEKRKDINIGFEMNLAKLLWIEFNAFNSDIVDLVTEPYTDYPSFYGDFKPYDNYNAERYSGFETGIQLTKKFSAASISFGTNMIYTKTKRTVYDEINLYEYQDREGKPVDAIFGLEADGFYQSSDFNADGSLVDGLPVPVFGDVQPGDIKYVNQNDDYLIDENDRKMIGTWSNPLAYSFNLNIGYNQFNLFIQGVGQYGGFSNMTNDYYWVDGNDKYSILARDRWTPETNDKALYPRLSSLNNNNNYRTSTFWMYNDSYFKLSHVQLSYSLSEQASKKLKMKHLSLYLAASNLIEIAENADIRQLNIGSAPQYRNYTIGLRSRF